MVAAGPSIPMLRDRAQQGHPFLAPGQDAAGPSIPMLRDRTQQGRPSLCSGTGRSRAVHPLLRDRTQQSRSSLCSGTGLRSQKKFLRSPVPTPMDGPNPQRQLHLRAAKGENALVFRVHNTKTSIKAAFCAAKGIIQPNYRAHNEERFTPLNSNLRPKNGLKWAGTMDHTDSQAQERPISGRSYGPHQLSSPRTA